MISDVQLERIAGAVSVLRPDWPAGSVKRFVLGHVHLMARPAQDLAVALVAVAMDPATLTPARVLEPGWWTRVLRPAAGDVVPVVRAPECPRHPGSSAGACDVCAATAAPMPASFRMDARSGGGR